MARDITAPPQAPTACTSLAMDIMGMDGDSAHAADAAMNTSRLAYKRRLAAEPVRNGPVERLAECVSQQKRHHRHLHRSGGGVKHLLDHRHRRKIHVDGERREGLQRAQQDQELQMAQARAKGGLFSNHVGRHKCIRSSADHPRSIAIPLIKEMRITIIGGGIIGLATALRLGQKLPGAFITVLEKEAGVGQHQSGHNSGVLHCGLYYKPGSMKARLAVTGIRQMIAFCQEHGIPHEVCGKLVVAATEDEVPRLNDLFERGQQNGLTGLRKLGCVRDARDRAACRRSGGYPRAGGRHRGLSSRLQYPGAMSRGSWRESGHRKRQ